MKSVIKNLQRRPAGKTPRRAVTLLELMVVVVIIAILSTIAVGIYTKEIQRARYARTRAELRTLEIAIAQYQVDTGQLPPSGSGNTFAPAALTLAGNAIGSGYLTMSLRTSLNGNLYVPLSTRWQGPYIDWDQNRIGDPNGTPVTDPANLSTTFLGQFSFLDAWSTPILYIRSDDYVARGGTELPSTSPFIAETYYNPSTYQLISFGANRTTLADPYRGTEVDDITNFRSVE
ncbi:prepilin-type N-terminal cleavage/methylation domain-containing protein [Candidatus Sumerlaeota bacterium]|nr:prepilin-type N-terminal cleavage/methylation domain-containing protein [Candidatus Sumerlaeota bacterium]HNM46311.1 prepilin-type N-terminal cleavage/methylation domain-containing protein [Candidatus Sumerlaeota bacterium]